MRKTSYQIEYDIDMIEQSVRDMYNLPDNWYGDTYGSLLENEWGTNFKILMEHCTNQEEYDDYLSEIRENFINAAKNYNEEE